MPRIPDPGFDGDDGAADPALFRVMSAYARDGLSAPAIAALCGSRLLVPVVAVPAVHTATAQGPAADRPADKAGDKAGGEAGGEAGDKAGDKAGGKAGDIEAVLLAGRDGRLALLAFTGLHAMRMWDGSARPVPVTAVQAAAAAIHEAASALVVDVAGPVLLVIEGEDLRRLAGGERLVPVGSGHAWLPAG